MRDLPLPSFFPGVERAVIGVGPVGSMQIRREVSRSATPVCRSARRRRAPARDQVRRLRPRDPARCLRRPPRRPRRRSLSGVRGADFYIRKDFDPKLGLAVVIIGALDQRGVLLVRPRPRSPTASSPAPRCIDLVVYGRLKDRDRLLPLPLRVPRRLPADGAGLRPSHRRRPRAGIRTADRPAVDQGNSRSAKIPMNDLDRVAASTIS